MFRKSTIYLEILQKLKQSISQPHDVVKKEMSDIWFKGVLFVTRGNCFINCSEYSEYCLCSVTLSFKNDINRWEHLEENIINKGVVKLLGVSAVKATLRNPLQWQRLHNVENAATRSRKKKLFWFLGRVVLMSNLKKKTKRTSVV